MTLNLTFLFALLGYFSSGPLHGATPGKPADAANSGVKTATLADEPGDAWKTASLPLLDIELVSPLVLLPLHTRSDQSLIASMNVLRARSGDLGGKGSEALPASFSDMDVIDSSDRFAPVLGFSRLVLAANTSESERWAGQSRRGSDCERSAAEFRTPSSSPRSVHFSHSPPPLLHRNDVAVAGSRLACAADSIRIFSVTRPNTARGQETARLRLDDLVRACGGDALLMPLLPHDDVSPLLREEMGAIEHLSALVDIGARAPLRAETHFPSPSLTIEVQMDKLAAAMSSRQYAFVLATCATAQLGLFEEYESAASILTALASAASAAADPVRAAQIELGGAHVAAGLPAPVAFDRSRLPAPPSAEDLSKLFEAGKRALGAGARTGSSWFKLTAHANTVIAHVTRGDVGYDRKYSNPILPHKTFRRILF